MAIRNLQVRIKQRVSAEGHPFSEIFYTYWDDSPKEGRDSYDCYALSRVWYPIPDTEHQRANEAQQFLKRRG